MALLWLDAQLNRSQVEFGRNASLHVRRAKQGRPSVHPIRGEELRLLTALRKEYPDSVYVFTSERGTPFTPDAINRLVRSIGQRAGLALPVHFHMLRHSCGYKLANDGIDTRAIQDWLGHVSITHTSRYTGARRGSRTSSGIDQFSVLVPAAVDMSVISRV